MMTEEQKQDIKTIKSQIKEFEDYKERIEKQQVTFPLDEQSKEVAYKDLFVPTGRTIYPFDTTAMTSYSPVEVIMELERYSLFTYIE